MTTTLRCTSVVATSLLFASPALPAAAFSSAHYDSGTNELVVTMIYSGSNPDHEFSIKWGECQMPGDGSAKHQIAGEIIDSQWNDTEQQTYTKTVRFGLASINCRPATVTLRTAPRFEYTVEIP